MRHRERKADGDRCVDGVAAGTQHLEPRRGRVRFRRADDAVTRVNGLARGAPGRDGRAHEERDDQGAGAEARNRHRHGEA